MNTIYFDNAATTKPLPSVVTDTIYSAITNYGNPSSSHEIGKQAALEIKKSKQSIMRNIGANCGDIIFTSGATEANNQVIMSLGTSMGIHPHIICSRIEHPSVLKWVHYFEEVGANVTYLDVNEKGFVDPQDVENAITKNTALVTVMWANNEIGTLQPVVQIGHICNKYGVHFHSDATQVVGHHPINISNLPIDSISFSAHKFHGFNGVGALYVKDATVLHSIIEGGHQQNGKRAGTENVAGIVSMASALNVLSEAEDKYHEFYIGRLSKLLRNNLSDIEGLQYNGDQYYKIPGIVNFRIEGVTDGTLVELLNQNDICVSSGSACMSSSNKPSHVLKAIGLTDEEAEGSIRVSLSMMNTEFEVLKFCDILKRNLEFIRGTA